MPGAGGRVSLAEQLVQTARCVQAVQAGRSLADALPGVPGELRPGVQALSFHVLRWLGAAEAVRSLCVPKTPPARVDALLVSALALLWPTGEAPPYPDHTLVDQAVASARHRTPAAAGFINAVLRRFLRDRAALVAQALHQPEAAYGHPAWWIERIRHDWPAVWQPLLQQAIIRRSRRRRLCRMQQLRQARQAQQKTQQAEQLRATQQRRPLVPEPRRPGGRTGAGGAQLSALSARRGDWSGR